MTMTQDERNKFFMSCPGLVGEMVRQVCDRSIQPIPSFCCAAALALVGSLRGSYRRLETNPRLTSNLFFICLAPSGSGKDFPRAALKEAAGRRIKKDVSLSGYDFIADKLRSSQGVLLDCSETDGVKCFLHDEAHAFFERANNKSDTILKAVKTLMLELFTSGNDAFFSAGKVLGKASDIPPLHFPSVSYCGFGVPAGFAEVFGLTDVDNGWANRIITIKEDLPMASYSTAYLSGRIGAKHDDEFTFESDVRWIELFQLANQAALERKEAGRQYKIPAYLGIEASADELSTSYSVVCEAEGNRARSEKRPNFWVRSHELAQRVALALTDDDIITEQTMLWAIEFVNMMVKGYEEEFHAAHEETTPLADRIEECLKEVASCGITPREIQRKIKKATSGQIKEVLVMLEESGIARSMSPKKENPRGGRPVTIWYHRGVCELD